MLAATCFLTLPSCSPKTAFPRDPYRGATTNPRSYPPRHDKVKRTHASRSVRVRPTYYNN